MILLCLMPDDFTHQERASGWERVKISILTLKNSFSNTRFLIDYPYWASTNILIQVLCFLLITIDL